MIATQYVSQAIVTLLSTDANSFADGAGSDLRLVVAPFTPSAGLLVGDLTYGAGNGLDPIVHPTGAPPWGIDPITGAFLIDIAPPAGGWKWTLVATAPPVTVYGVAMVNGTTMLLIGTMLLPQPVVMQTIHQILDVGSIDFTLAQVPFS
jgi:hypothetical protein